MFTTESKTSRALYISITSADGKTHNLGRVDRKWWAPRLWFYKFVTYPYLASKYPHLKE